MSRVGTPNNTDLKAAEVRWPHFESVPEAAHLPLRGVRVLDLSALLPGPVATRSLADLGAQVLKVERVDGGDPMRGLMPDSFDAVNRNKRSLALDLKTVAAQKLVQRLTEQAHVFVEGFRPGVTRRLGCDAETLRALNPRLVYCSISGYGQHSQRRNEPGHDVNYLAIAGALAPDLTEGEPSTLLPAADMLAATQATTAICAALIRAEKTGQGSYIDISMTDCVVAAMSHLINEQAQTRAVAEGRHPAYGVFTAADGVRIAVGCTETSFYVQLCEELGLADLLVPAYMDYQTRKKAWKTIELRIGSAIGARDGAHWLDKLTSAGLPVTPVHTLTTVRADSDLVDRGLLDAVSDTIQVPFPALFDGQRPGHRSDAPALGEANASTIATPFV